MSEWKSLAWNVYKDLYLMRRALAFYSSMVLVFAALYSGWNLGPALGVLAASVVMAPNWLAYTEERSGGLVLQRTLPVAPWVVVGAKYVDAALVATWLGLLTLGAGIVARGGAEMSPASALPTLGLTAIVAAAALVPAGLSLWAFFRWGYQAARHAILAFVVVVLGVVMPLSERLPAPRVTSRDLAMGMVTQGSGLSGWAVAAATGASLALYLLAAVAACRALRAREL